MKVKFIYHIILMLWVSLFVTAISRVYAQGSDPMVFPLKGSNDETIQVSIHLNTDYSQKIYPIFYGTGTLFGADLIGSKRGSVVYDYELGKAIQLIDRQSKVKIIRMAAVPKKTPLFGSGSEIFELHFKINNPDAAYFVLHRFHFGSKIYGKNTILNQHVIRYCPKNIHDCEQISYHGLRVCKKSTIVSQKF